MFKISHILLTNSPSKHTFILVKTFKLPRSAGHSIFSTLKMTKMVISMSEFVTPAIFCVPADVCFQQTETSASKMKENRDCKNFVLVLSHRTTHYSTYHRTSNNIMISIENIHLQGCDLSKT
jgi:ribonucleotide monophosphatase NagD (HAD superfamily)